MTNSRKPGLVEAIVSLVPNAQVSTMETDTDWEINWIVPSSAPVTNAQLKTEIARLGAEWDALQYQRNRADAYPKIEDQLDTLFHGGINAWKAQIQEVKDQFPKP